MVSLSPEREVSVILSGPTSSIVARVLNGIGASASAGHRATSPDATINQTRLRGSRGLGMVASMVLSREMLAAQTAPPSKLNQVRAKEP
jgi:uncharacterized protein (DUF4213/DUF364 family)